MVPLVLLAFVILLLVAYFADKALVDKNGDIKDLPARPLKPTSTVTLLTGGALGFLSVALATHGYSESCNKDLTGIRDIGLALIGLGGCFDPINMAWLLLPFTSSKIAVSPRNSKYGLPLIAIGVLIGLFYYLVANKWEISQHGLP